MTLAWLGAAWLLGVAAAAFDWPLRGLPPVGMLAAGVAAAALYRRPQALAFGLLAGALFLGGAWRYDGDAPSPDGGLAVSNDGAAVRFRALVSEEPDVRGRSQRVRLSVREVWQGGGWQAAAGGVLLRSAPFPAYRYGDLLQVTGELKTPPALEEFDYREYLTRQGVQSIITYPRVDLISSGAGNDLLEAVHGVRRRLGGALADALPEPEASLGQGILLGQRSTISASLVDDMNTTGLSHIVAVSGYNVSVVAGLVVSGLAWLLGRRQAALVALLGIAFYTVLTGAEAPIVRAAVMGGLFLLATLVGRPGSALTGVVVAAAFMTARDPLALRDVSFQLSFAATIGIVYVAPALQTRALAWAEALGLAEPRRGPLGVAIETTAVTVAAIAATLPIIALNFGRISIVAPLANLLVVPLFPLQLGLSAMTAMAGALWQPLGEAAAWASWLPLTYMVQVSRLLAGAPMASVDVDSFGLGHAAITYAGLGVVAWWVQPRRPFAEALARIWRRASRPLALFDRALGLVPAAWSVAALALAAGLLWWANLSGGDGRLAVSFLDVGQGDAILIRGPEGQQVLVDGGPSAAALREALGREMPFWDHDLDLVVLTHPQEDHITGLIEALDRYDVDQALAPDVDASTGAYFEWRRLLAEREVPLVTAAAGQWIDLGDGARIEVLPPPASPDPDELNNASVVLRLVWGDVSFLLTGDIEAEREAELVDGSDELRATVLKVAHHGSATSTGDEFLRAVRPAVAVISVGEGNQFRHPSPEVVERLDGTLLYRTDLNGRVRLSTDGERLWVEVDRGGPAP